jgi:hypothetical protein
MRQPVVKGTAMQAVQRVSGDDQRIVGARIVARAGIALRRPLEAATPVEVFVGDRTTALVAQV